MPTHQRAPKNTDLFETKFQSVMAQLGLDIRRGERLMAFSFSAYYFVLFFCFYASKVVRQFTFVDALGAARLPVVYFLVAIGSYPILRLYGHCVDRIPRKKLVSFSNLFLGATLAFFYFAFSWSAVAVPILFYVWMTIAFAVAISQFWSYANTTMDPRQAKRIFALVAAGGSLGGILGAQAVRVFAAWERPEMVLLLSAVLLAAVPGLLFLARHAHQSHPKRKPATGIVDVTPPKGGFAVIFGDPLLRLIAILTAVSIMAAQVVDLQFNWVVEQATTDSGARAVLFANLYSLISLAALFFQVFFTARIHRRMGVGTAMRILPSSIALGTVALIGLGSFFPAALLILACGLKFTETGFRYSFEQVTRELLFLPVSQRGRQTAKAYIDVFVQRFAKGLAALLLLSVSFAWLTPIQAGFMTLVICLFWLVVASMTKRRYITAYRNALKTPWSNRFHGHHIEASDVTALELLVQSLGSPEAPHVLHAMEHLESQNRSHLIPPLLLYHDSADVRRKTLTIMARGDRREALPLVTKCLRDPNVEVRIEAVHAFATLRREDASRLMRPRIKSNDPRERAAAIACLATAPHDAFRQQATEALNDMASDGESDIRAEAAKSLGQIPEPVYENQLLRLLSDRDENVARHAARAVKNRTRIGRGNPIYLPRLISLSRIRGLKHDCRKAIAAYGKPAIPPLVHFMTDSMEHPWVRRAAPKTIAAIGGEEAARALVDNLDDSDSFLRRKLVEALVSLQSRGVDMDFGRDDIQKTAGQEAKRYWRMFLHLRALGMEPTSRMVGALVVWNNGEPPPALLRQLLAERMREALINLLHLASLTVHGQGIRDAAKNLVSSTAGLHHHAIEYLDNALSGNIHRTVFSVIDDTPLEDRLARAERLFGMRRQTREETLRHLIFKQHDQLTAAALYTVYEDRIESLMPFVLWARDNGKDAFIVETAQWVIDRLSV